MAMYTPLPEPANVEELLLYVNTELKRISEATDVPSELRLNERNSAPARPREGTIVYADGTNWEPVSDGGEGYYGYTNGVWVPLYTPTPPPPPPGRTALADLARDRVSQTFSFPAASYGAGLLSTSRGFGIIGSAGTNNDLGTFDDDFKDDSSIVRRLTQLSISSSNNITIGVTGASGVGGTHDLSAAFELNGSVTIDIGSNSLTIELDSADVVEPYTWAPSNSTEISTFYNAIPSTAGATAGTATFNVTPSVGVWTSAINTDTTQLEIDVADVTDYKYITISSWAGTDTTPKIADTTTFLTSEIPIDTTPVTGEASIRFGSFGSRQRFVLVGRNEAGTTLYFRSDSSDLDTGRIMGIWGGDF